METLTPSTLNGRPGTPLRVRCLIGLPRKPRGCVAQLYAEPSIETQPPPPTTSRLPPYPTHQRPPIPPDRFAGRSLSRREPLPAPGQENGQSRPASVWPARPGLPSGCPADGAGIEDHRCRARQGLRARPGRCAPVAFHLARTLRYPAGAADDLLQMVQGTLWRMTPTANRSAHGPEKRPVLDQFSLRPSRERRRPAGKSARRSSDAP